MVIYPKTMKNVGNMNNYYSELNFEKQVVSESDWTYFFRNGKR